MTSIRTYSQMLRHETFEDRFEYLNLRGVVGESTFGFERHLNQKFYRSSQWRNIRDHVIARDFGMDLGIDGHEIFERPIIHHMNPMTSKDLIDGNQDVLDPEFLITVSHNTHNAIHYGDKSLLPQPLVERHLNDHIPWR